MKKKIENHLKYARKCRRKERLKATSLKKILLGLGKLVLRLITVCLVLPFFLLYLFLLWLLNGGEGAIAHIHILTGKVITDQHNYLLAAKNSGIFKIKEKEKK